MAEFGLSAPTFHVLRWCPLHYNPDALLKGAPTFHVLRWCPLHCNTDVLLKGAPTFHVLRWCPLHYNTDALLRGAPTFHVLRWCPPSFLFLCKVIGVNFNIMSAVFAHQQLTRSQIFNSRASFFVVNRGVSLHHWQAHFVYVNANLLQRNMLFAAKTRLFAAKHLAICR